MSILTNYAYYWEYWQLYHKVTFDGPNRLILINEGVTEIDVRRDIYSAWKEWMQLRELLENAGYLEAIRAVGGDPITETRALGSTFFLRNNWKIRPWSGAYTLEINGNLFTDEGDSPYIEALGDNNSITLRSNVSNLIDQINNNFGIPQSQQLDELHKIHGLNRSAPLEVTQETRKAGDNINQTITKGPGPEGEEPVTVTRDPGEFDGDD